VSLPREGDGVASRSAAQIQDVVFRTQVQPLDNRIHLIFRIGHRPMAVHQQIVFSETFLKPFRHARLLPRLLTSAQIHFTTPPVESPTMRKGSDAEQKRTTPEVPLDPASDHPDEFIQ